MHNNPSGGAHFNAGPSSQEGESLANELGNAQQYLSELEALSHRIVLHVAQKCQPKMAPGLLTLEGQMELQRQLKIERGKRQELELQHAAALALLRKTYGQVVDEFIAATEKLHAKDAQLRAREHQLLALQQQLQGDPASGYAADEGALLWQRDVKFNSTSSSSSEATKPNSRSAGGTSEGVRAEAAPSPPLPSTSYLSSQAALPDVHSSRGKAGNLQGPYYLSQSDREGDAVRNKSLGESRFEEGKHGRRGGIEGAGRATSFQPTQAGDFAGSVQQEDGSLHTLPHVLVIRGRGEGRDGSVAPGSGQERERNVSEEDQWVMTAAGGAGHGYLEGPNSGEGPQLQGPTSEEAPSFPRSPTRTSTARGTQALHLNNGRGDEGGSPSCVQARPQVHARRAPHEPALPSHTTWLPSPMDAQTAVPAGAAAPPPPSPVADAAPPSPMSAPEWAGSSSSSPPDERQQPPEQGYIQLRGDDGLQGSAWQGSPGIVQEQQPYHYQQQQRQQQQQSLHTSSPDGLAGSEAGSSSAPSSPTTSFLMGYYSPKAYSSTSPEDPEHALLPRLFQLGSVIGYQAQPSGAGLPTAQQATAPGAGLGYSSQESSDEEDNKFLWPAGGNAARTPATNEHPRPASSSLHTSLLPEGDETMGEASSSAQHQQRSSGGSIQHENSPTASLRAFLRTASSDAAQRVNSIRSTVSRPPAPPAPAHPNYTQRSPAAGSAAAPTPLHTGSLQGPSAPSQPPAHTHAHASQHPSTAPAAVPPQPTRRPAAQGPQAPDASAIPFPTALAPTSSATQTSVARASLANLSHRAGSGSITSRPASRGAASQPQAANTLHAPQQFLQGMGSKATGVPASTTFQAPSPPSRQQPPSEMQPMVSTIPAHNNPSSSTPTHRPHRTQSLHMPSSAPPSNKSHPQLSGFEQPRSPVPSFTQPHKQSKAETDDQHQFADQQQKAWRAAAAARTAQLPSASPNQQPLFSPGWSGGAAPGDGSDRELPKPKSLLEQLNESTAAFEAIQQQLNVLRHSSNS